MVAGEMAIGHIIQNLLKQQNAQAATNLSLVQLQDRVKTQQAAVETLRSEVDTLRGDIKRLQVTVARLETANERLMAQSGLTPDVPDERQSAQTG
jgi:phage shock protein A